MKKMTGIIVKRDFSRRNVVIFKLVVRVSECDKVSAMRKLFSDGILNAKVNGNNNSDKF